MHVIRSQIHLARQAKVRGADAKLIRRRGFLEDLVPVGVLHFQEQVPFSYRVVVRAIQRERPHVNHLSRLINRLFGRQENPDFVLQPDCLCVLRRSQ